MRTRLWFYWPYDGDADDIHLHWYGVGLIVGKVRLFFGLVSRQ
jgi:hypothetical protein